MSIGDIYYFAITQDITDFGNFEDDEDDENENISNFFDSNIIIEYKVRFIRIINTNFFGSLREFEILEDLSHDLKGDLQEPETICELTAHNAYTLRMICQSIVIPWDKYMNKTEYVLK